MTLINFQGVYNHNVIKQIIYNFSRIGYTQKTNNETLIPNPYLGKTL